MANINGNVIRSPVLSLCPTIFFASSTPTSPKASPPTIVLLDQNFFNEKASENKVYGFSRFPSSFDPISAPAVAPAITAREI